MRDINNFKYNIGDVIKDEKRDLIILDKDIRERFKKSRGKNERCNERFYKLKCNTCGWDDLWIEEYNLLNSYGCSCCRGLTVVEGINDISTIAPWMIPYFQGGYDEAKLYSIGSHKKINPICPICGEIRNKEMTIKDIYRCKSIACTCSDGISYPNKFIRNLVLQCKDQLQDYEFEYSPLWIRPKRYDCYFVKDNIPYVIEVDGRFHSEDNKMSGQTKEESLDIDHFKDKIAKANCIKVIRIDAKISDLDYIKNNILHSKLANILNLNNVDWIKCHADSLKNIIKEVAEYKNSNKNATTTMIAHIFNLNPVTIRTYLKKGTKLGWCNYNPKEEILKASKQYTDNQNKIVICVTTNEIFYSGKSAALYYNVNYADYIYRCCRGLRKNVNGLTWRYFNELEDDFSSFILPESPTEASNNV